MIERKEVIFNSQETREAVKEAIEVGGVEEAQRRGINVDEIRTLHPNEIVIEKPEPFEKAKEWLDAVVTFALPIWIEQLRVLGMRDSGYWLAITKERENAKRKRAK